ncbi:MAG: LLM class flavin-dependent oxidoreductase, partial [Pseudomonadales bacterium]|nr:LLM class flavin-dependent oxidoreductase [Pseudomonadales bacterium]
IEWDFEGKARKIRFLNPDLGLIDIGQDIPLWFSAFGPGAKRMAADLRAGWLNFGAQGAIESLQEMQDIWTDTGSETEALQSNLFFLGAVLDGDPDADRARLMSEAAPLTAVMFHNMADEVGAMGGRNLPTGTLSNLLSEYMQTHERYEPADARYLTNHRGHLMFVRPEETHLSEDLVKATTMSGTREELVERMRALAAAGYDQVTVQLVHNHESAIERWADVFRSI